MMDKKRFGLTAQRLSEVINRVIDGRISRIAPTEWDENHISLTIVSALRDVLEVAGKGKAAPSHPPVHIRAEAYKVTGGMERLHGDIAILVNNLDLGLTGMGFYEAKASDADGFFPAFDMRQLRRLTSASPRLSLLLYERSPMPILDDDFSFPSQIRDSNGSARARVVGANIISRLRDRPVILPGVCAQSFGYQFITRYLSGKDLDYSRKPHLELRRWLRATKRTEPVIVEVSFTGFDNRVPELSPPVGYEKIPAPVSHLSEETIAGMLASEVERIDDVEE
jgi:hypothetical protein